MVNLQGSMQSVEAKDQKNDTYMVNIPGSMLDSLEPKR